MHQVLAELCPFESFCKLFAAYCLELGPNIHWTSNYGTGIVFIGNMLSWLSFHNFV